MCCTGPLWGGWSGWGMPWIMFLVPILILVFMFLVCRYFRPRFTYWCGHQPMPGGQWAEEVRILRQEMDELRKSIRI